MLARFEIIADAKTMTITVGDRVFDRPNLFHRAEYFYEIKEHVCGPARLEEGVKSVNKFYCDLLGPKFNRRFQAANYHLWIGDRLLKSTADMLRLRGKNWRHYSNELVYRANLALPYVQEAERDGLHHLIPAIVVFGASPQAIRQTIGGVAWRQIAHNSRTRNRKIMHAIEYCHKDNWGAAFVDLLSFPSGVLSGVSSLGPDEIMAARLCSRKTYAGFEATTHTVRDTRRMLGNINPDWSLARLEREHANAVTAMHRKVFSGEAFAGPWNFAKVPFTATLLTTQLAIAVEGDVQHHCVASYARHSARHAYAVVRIEGHERATAGYRRDGQNWRLDQVYGACNAAAGPACRDFAESVARALPSRLPQPDQLVAA